MSTVVEAGSSEPGPPGTDAVPAHTGSPRTRALGMLALVGVAYLVIARVFMGKLPTRWLPTNTSASASAQLTARLPVAPSPTPRSLRPAWRTERISWSSEPRKDSVTRLSTEAEAGLISLSETT